MALAKNGNSGSKQKEEPSELVRISVRSLVEFLLRSGDIDNRSGGGIADPEAMRLGSLLHRKIQKKMGSQYRAEVPLSGVFACDDFQICVEGRADGIWTDEDGVLIDEIKGIMRPLSLVLEPVPVHLAQAKCYAYLYGLQQGFGEDAEQTLRVRMSYGSLETEEMKYFHFTYSFGQLEEWFTGILEEYRKWARFERQWKETRKASIKATQFPFAYREGQKDLAAAVYRTIHRKKMLFIQAPTGTGKTLSTLFPAVKAMGEGEGERIFYLTARTIARTVAAQALDQLRGQGLRMKSVVLTAKEKICPLEECLCNPEDCPYAKGHYDRINQALYALLTRVQERWADSFDRQNLLEAAGEYQVCPFELSLDLSLWMDVVICDYNYVFDPRARLKRFFGEGVKSDGILLVDEAHNLVERAREMYSAQLVKEDFLAVKREVKGNRPKLARMLEKCSRLLLEMKRAIGEPLEGDPPIAPRRGELWRVQTDLGTLPLTLLNASGLLEEALSEDPQSPDLMRDLYFQVLTFLDTLDRMGEDYIPYTEILQDGSFVLRLFCVDPSRRLQECMDRARSCVLFSATLLPIDYYTSLLTTREDPYAVYAKSCFPEEHLQVLVGRDTSTRYTRRGEAEFRRIAAYIRTAIEGRRGNYMAFFPSYRMLEDVGDYVEELLPEGYKLLRQESGMNEAQREEFLQAFSRESPGGLLGLCVMGSIFGEGIDLKGEALIGAIIVGAGLPMVCTQREILRQYYDRRGRDGFRFAYMCPGMNKVLQAAGRVIRTERDRGVALLLDERFAQSAYQSMFPREWSRHRVCTLKDAGVQIEAFWERQMDRLQPLPSRR